MSDLTTGESKDFKRLDAIVQAGLKTFIEVGTALAEIRDRELWRENFISFVDYTESYGWSKTHAYRLIESAKTAISVSQIWENATPNESQSHELAAAGEKASEAWVKALEIAAAQGKAATASICKEAVQAVLHENDPFVIDESAYEDDAEYEEEDWQPDDVIEIADGSGEVVQGLADWEILSEANDEPLILAMQQLRKIRDAMEAESKNPWLQYAGPAVKTQLGAAINSIKSATCGGVCGKCEGVGCDFCHQTGYLSTDEMRKART